MNVRPTARAQTFTGGVIDEDVLCAALLHDTVEDTDTTFDELTQHFGARISNIVRECTDDKALSSVVRKELQVTNGPHKTHEAKLVKLADKLYNLRDLTRATPVGWSEARVHEYFKWASRVCCGLIGTHALLEAKVNQVLSPHNVSIENPSHK
jgi:guanosine-3',5'-bis(diphosphate) 3'-pyrophosphohydrolase